MNYYNIHNVDDINKLICSQKDTTNFSGILSCSQYFGPDKTINYGINYLNGELYQKTKDILPLNYEFNNINFANIINSDSNIENVDQCYNANNCINKELYARKEFKANDLVSNREVSELCNEKKLCEIHNHTTNNKYLFKKLCYDDDCSYSLNCGCDKK